MFFFSMICSYAYYIVMLKLHKSHLLLSVDKYLRLFATLSFPLFFQFLIDFSVSLVLLLPQNNFAVFFSSREICENNEP